MTQACWFFCQDLNTKKCLERKFAKVFDTSCSGLIFFVNHCFIQTCFFCKLLQIVLGNFGKICKMSFLNLLCNLLLETFFLYNFFSDIHRRDPWCQTKCSYFQSCSLLSRFGDCNAPSTSFTVVWLLSQGGQLYSQALCAHCGRSSVSRRMFTTSTPLKPNPATNSQARSVACIWRSWSVLKGFSDVPLSKKSCQRSCFSSEASTMAASFWTLRKYWQAPFPILLDTYIIWL